jgi:Ca2+-binding RTX toxin-like protein
LLGGSGNDNMGGNDGNDFIYAGTGDDLVHWWLGDVTDIVDGGLGRDVQKVYGSNGNDSFVLRRNSTNDVILDTSQPGSSLLIDNIEQIDVQGNSGNDLLTVGNLDGTDLTVAAFIGGDGNDTLDGSGTNTTLWAWGENGNDSLVGGNGADWFSGGDGNDTLLAGAGADYLEGNNGNDVLSGENGNDSLYGGDGNDSLSGGTGNDSIFGGAGDDAIRWNSGDGNDTIDGGTGYDTLTMYGDSISEDFFITTGFGSGLGGVGSQFTNVEQIDVVGNSGNDLLTISGNTNGGLNLITFNAGDGNDTLDGANSVVGIESWGGAGMDSLIGGFANDTLSAGSGNDDVDGNDGDDKLWGGYGDDTLLGGDGDDQIVGGNGGSIPDFLDGNDWLEGGAGNDTLWGGTGSDLLNGGTGNDVLYGGGSNNSLVGDAGNDSLEGGTGNDTLLGGAGNDRLLGGGGVDLLDGGTGSDVFVLDDGSLNGIYLGSGYALMQNWQSNDWVEVSASFGSRYSWGFGNYGEGSGALDTAIFYNNDLIGVIQDSTNFSFSNFRFV